MTFWPPLFWGPKVGRFLTRQVVEEHVHKAVVARQIALESIRQAGWNGETVELEFPTTRMSWFESKNPGGFFVNGVTSVFLKVHLKFTWKIRCSCIMLGDFYITLFDTWKSRLASKYWISPSQMPI